MRVVYATANASVATAHGRVIPVRFGTHWSAEDPLVKEHPGLFSDEPLYGMSHSSPAAQELAETPVIEIATSEPGEKRAVRRPA